MALKLAVPILASEAELFVKVAGSLPLALRALPGDARLDVRLVLPLHTPPKHPGEY